MGRGYGITPPAYWLLAAWHWSETGKPAYRGRYEYAKAWLLFMIKAYLIWKWEQARWLKEHWVVGQKGKKKDWGRNRESEEEKRRERHLQIHTGGEVWKLECHSYLAAAVKQVSNIADLTSLDTKVVLTFATFCRFHHKFSSRNESFWVKEKKISLLQIGSRTKTDLITLKSCCTL